MQDYLTITWMILSTLITMLSIVGVGVFFILKLSIKKMSVFELFMSSIFAGMALFSFYIFFLSTLKVFRYDFVFYLKIVGFVIFLKIFIKNFGKIKNMMCKKKFVILSFFTLFLFFTLSTVSNVLIHGDAKQYNLAFPWLMSVTGHLVNNDTLLHNGTYISFDILYLSIGDLRDLLYRPDLIDKIKLFDSNAAFLLPLSIYMLSRRLEISEKASLLASFAILTIGSINNWGEIKNDIFSSAIGISSLCFILIASKTKDHKILFLASFIAGWAVSVKLTNAIILVLPFFYLYLIGFFSKKYIFISILTGMLPLLPWMLYAYHGTGSLISPELIKLPPEINYWWGVRNANGLPHGMITAINYFEPILMNSYKISGNDSIGVFSLLSIVVSLLYIMRVIYLKEFNMNSIILISVMIWFFIFYIMRYDNRFLSRYIIAPLSIFIIYAISYLEQLAGKYKNILIFFLCSLIAYCSFNKDNARRLNDIAKILNVTEMQKQKLSDLDSYEKPYKYLNAIRKNGEAVAVNEHTILFVNPPFYNLNPLHAINLNLYRMSQHDIKKYIEQKNIKYFIFRKINSWGYDNINNYVMECTDLIKPFDNGNLNLLRVKDNCNV
ncbi:hypothetical protein [Sodalis sp. RH16]|uniref:hypothetical protein n=1 Tax=Sodalis sp. RH16 TaxID=3394331 RepID=UPI0039B3DDBE